ncbi:aminoacyl tRNA synthase complex-interacting multifunctional protein 2 isoform X2 [Nasonia vitripennis]|uniref:AIMP2 thioredoxin-like domain-containing protein n=1 Tax=Nasonia vitripennis TaxID=7425 RepID=A0A7M7G6J5_NASVI|nr:aminoacyl tRNA synthase complex-interacting multifunctional protein 2 isoform X2 [Nasonia vitripennis]
MSGAATRMYALKPVVSLPEKIALPSVMYELPRIQGGSASCKTAEQGAIAADIAEQMKLPEYNVLEARQVKILKQIYELKQQVECLCVAVRLSDVNNPAEVLNKLNLDITADEAPIRAEIIVSANPNSPPYSILALQRLWKDTKFNVEVHRHSTVSDATTQAFEEKLLSDASKDAVHSIDVTLIWKDVSDVQLVTKVYDYPLEGEANVLRYLTRLIENYNYEKSPSVVHTIDSILDLCLRLSYEEARNVNAITSKIASYLDKKTWLLDGSNASIADVAAWSVLKRVASNRVPRELKNWYDVCEKTFLSV